MDADTEQSVECGGCGRVYHVPPATEVRRAKCARCGASFEIPLQRVIKPAERRPPQQRQSAMDQRTMAAAATRLASRQDARQNRVSDGWWMALAAAVAGVVAMVVFIPADEPSLPPPFRAATPARGEEDPAEAQREAMYPQSPRGGFRSLTDLILAVEPAVVQLEGRGSVGAGFVLDPSGLVVSCHHCVENQAGLEAVFADGRRFKVLGVSTLSAETDLVILKIDAQEPLRSLKVSRGGDRKGDPVVAFGSPERFSFTPSEGNIIALRTFGEIDRQVPGVSFARSCRLVQHDTVTTRGNSGGPIVNFRGEVVGVESFGHLKDDYSVSFAISWEEIGELAPFARDEPIALKELWPEAKPVDLGKLPDLSESLLD